MNWFAAGKLTKHFNMEDFILFFGGRLAEIFFKNNQKTHICRHFCVYYGLRLWLLIPSTNELALWKQWHKRMIGIRIGIFVPRCFGENCTYKKEKFMFFLQNITRKASKWLVSDNLFYLFQFSQNVQSSCSAWLLFFGSLSKCILCLSFVIFFVSPW